MYFFEFDGLCRTKLKTIFPITDIGYDTFTTFRFACDATVTTM